MQQELTTGMAGTNRGPSFDTLPILESVWTTRQKIGPRPDEMEHKLSRYQFDIQLGDPVEIEARQNGEKIRRTARFGDLSWTPAGDSCRATWHAVREMGFVTLSPSFVERTAAETGIGKLPEYAFFSSADSLIRELVLALVRDSAKDRMYSELLATTLVVHFLTRRDKRSELLKSTLGRLSSTQLEKAVQYVEDRLGEEIDLQSWAQEVGLSAFHFSRLFKRATGFAPHQFLLHRRVERAKAALAFSEMPISSVAYDLGFSSQSHFNRVFRQFTQMTPGAWRNTAQ